MKIFYDVAVETRVFGAFMEEREEMKNHAKITYTDYR